MKRYKKRLLAILIASILILNLGACTLASTSTSGPTSTSTLEQSTPYNFIAAVAEVMPSVVEIEVTHGPHCAPSDPQAQGGAGTGWVIRGDEVIVTNNHVVESPRTVTVILPDGTKQAAIAIQANPVKDLAVGKIASQNLPTVVTGDSSQLELGQPVVAFGNALNMGIRLTMGVVSQLNVPVNYDSVSLTGLIETDAATPILEIAAACSINILGRVIGIPNAEMQDLNLDV
jgi:putative serine protease PepD